MAKMYIWEEDGCKFGVVVSEEHSIFFHYLELYSHMGITVTQAYGVAYKEALLKGKLVESLLPEYHTAYERFLLTCPSSGLWKLMSDNTWVNHK